MLQRLANFDDGDQWRDFNERSRPPIVAYAWCRGLPDVDAEDAAQEALVAFTQTFRAGDHQRNRGRLSNRRLGIARVAVYVAKHRELSRVQQLVRECDQLD